MNPITLLALIIMMWAFMAAERNWAVTRKTDAWKKAAAKLGLTYFGRDNSLFVQFSSPRSLQEARKHRAECIEGIRGELGLKEIIVAHLCVPPNSINRRSQYWKAMTVCVVSAPEMELPDCLLRPQVPVIDSLGRRFGGQDIDFIEDQEFSKAFVLQGSSEASIRRLFNADLRSWFTDHQDKRLHFEGGRHVFLLYTHKMISPANIRTLITDALGIHRFALLSEPVPA
jgi:hypothetical protein